jgi:hypothetical protein
MILHAIRFCFTVIIIVGFGLIGVTSFAADKSAKTILIEETLRDMQKVFSFEPGQTFIMDGVNCHSTSLNKAGFLTYPTFVDLAEFNYIIDNFCEKIPSPVPGALAAFDRHHRMNNHSYFHINKNQIFEKKGIRGSEAYLIRNAGYYKNVEYFKCQPPQSTCDDKRVHQIEKRIRLVGIYYANFVSGRVATKTRDTFQAFLEQNLYALKELSVTPRCAVLKETLMQRASSLSIFAAEMDATFLTQFLPRGQKN